MTSPIEELRKSLPPNLFVNATADQYYYRDPRSGRTKSLGCDQELAIAFVTKKNLTNGIFKKGDRAKRFVRSAAFIEEEGLLSEAELTAIAQPIRQLCGVYLLLSEGRVVYVGQSTNCHGRIGTHFAEHEFEQWADALADWEREPKFSVRPEILEWLKDAPPFEAG